MIYSCSLLNQVQLNALKPAIPCWKWSCCQMNGYVIPYLEHQRPWITSSLHGDKEEKWDWYRQTILKLSFAVTFSRYILCTSVTGLGGGYYACSWYLLRFISMHMIVDSAAQRTMAKLKLLKSLSMHPLKQMHKNTCCYGKYQNECIGKTSRWLWVSSSCMNSQINIFISGISEKENQKWDPLGCWTLSFENAYTFFMCLAS